MTIKNLTEMVITFQKRDGQPIQKIEPNGEIDIEVYPPLIKVLIRSYEPEQLCFEMTTQEKRLMGNDTDFRHYICSQRSLGEVQNRDSGVYASNYKDAHEKGVEATHFWTCDGLDPGFPSAKGIRIEQPYPPANGWE